MATYKFIKEWSYATSAYVEAESFEEAKKKIQGNEYRWVEEDGGEHFIQNSYAALMTEDGEEETEYKWSPYEDN